jgi:hypothetical protein
MSRRGDGKVEKGLMKGLEFCSKFFISIQPDSEYMSECCDYTSLLDKVSDNILKAHVNSQRKEDRGSVTQEEDVKVLEQLTEGAQKRWEGEDMYPFNISNQMIEEEAERMEQSAEALDKKGGKLTRAKLFEQYFFMEDDNQLRNLISPIKRDLPQEEEDNYDEGTPIFFKKEKKQSNMDRPKKESQKKAVLERLSSKSFEEDEENQEMNEPAYTNRFGFFAKKPYQKVFEDLTNNPTFNYMRDEKQEVTNKGDEKKERNQPCKEQKASKANQRDDSNKENRNMSPMNTNPKESQPGASKKNNKKVVEVSMKNLLEASSRMNSKPEAQRLGSKVAKEARPQKEPERAEKALEVRVQASKKGGNAEIRNGWKEQDEFRDQEYERLMRENYFNKKQPPARNVKKEDLMNTPPPMHGNGGSIRPSASNQRASKASMEGSEYFTGKMGIDIHKLSEQALLNLNSDLLDDY